MDSVLIRYAFLIYLIFTIKTVQTDSDNVQKAIHAANKGKQSLPKNISSKSFDKIPSETANHVTEDTFNGMETRDYNSGLFPTNSQLKNEDKFILLNSRTNYINNADKRHIASIMQSRYLMSENQNNRLKRNSQKFDKKHVGSLLSNRYSYMNRKNKKLKGADVSSPLHNFSDEDNNIVSPIYNDDESQILSNGQSEIFQPSEQYLEFVNEDLDKKHLSSLFDSVSSDNDKRYIASLLKNRFEKRHLSSLLDSFGTGKRHFSSLLDNSPNKRYLASLLDSEPNKRYLASLLDSEPNKRYLASLLDGELNKRYLASLLDGEPNKRYLASLLDDEPNKRHLASLLDDEPKKKYLASLLDGEPNKGNLGSFFDDEPSKRHLGSFLDDEPSKRHIGSFLDDKTEKGFLGSLLDDEPNKRYLASLLDGEPNKRYLASLLDGEPNKRYLASLFDGDSSKRHLGSFLDDEQNKRHLGSFLDDEPNKRHLGSFLDDKTDNRFLGSLLDDGQIKRHFSSLLDDKPNSEKKHLGSIVNSAAYTAPEKRYLASLLDDRQNEDNKEYLRALFQSKLDADKRHLASIVNSRWNTGKRHTSLENELSGLDKRNLSSTLNNGLSHSSVSDGVLYRLEKRYFASLLDDRFPRQEDGLYLPNLIYSRQAGNDKRHLASIADSTAYRPSKKHSSSIHSDSSAFQKRNELKERASEISAFVSGEKISDKDGTNFGGGVQPNEKRHIGSLRGMPLEKRFFSTILQEENNDKKRHPLTKRETNIIERKRTDNEGLSPGPFSDKSLTRAKRYIGSLARSNNLPFRQFRRTEYAPVMNKYIDFIENSLQEALNQESVEQHVPNGVKIGTPTITIGPDTDPYEQNEYYSKNSLFITPRDTGFFNSPNKRFLESLPREMWFPRRYRSYIPSNKDVTIGNHAPDYALTREHDALIRANEPSATINIPLYEMLPLQ